MKKFLFCMFAAMLIVPTFSGCGDSTEATTIEDTGASENGEMSDEEYEKQAMGGGEEE